MSKCEECINYFAISEGSDDAESGKGDCVAEKKDDKGKYWTAKEMSKDMESCPDFQAR